MVRSAKLRQKVSGRLRTLAGATQFCAIRAVGAENSVLLCRVPRTVSCPLTRALVTYRAAPWGPITLPYAASPTTTWLAPAAFVASTGSAISSTNISRSRDAGRISGTHRVKGRRERWERNDGAAQEHQPRRR
jgi:hypothetical protein